MLGVLDHPNLIYEWFTTVLLRWSDQGLVVYDRWVVGGGGFQEWNGQGGGAVLLDFYYFMYLTAFVHVVVLMGRWRRQGWLKVRKHVPYDALLVAMLGVLIGAKTAYIFIYNPEFYFGDPPMGPADTSEMLHRIFLNWSGMASHGAAAGILLGAFLWWLKSRAPVLHLGDAGCTAGAFGAICIRLANFMNGELYGRGAPSWLPWAMRFEVHNKRGNKLYMMDGQWYERVVDPATQAAKRVPVDEPYRLGFELMHKGSDGSIQHFAPGETPADLQHTFLQVVTTPRHPSQLYQLLLEGVLLFAFLLFMKRKVKRAGQLAGWFFIGYPVARFLGEFFRQPDVQFQSSENALGTVLAGMSMGQLLSLAMFLFGIGLLAWSSLRGKVMADMPIWPPEKKSDGAAGKPEQEKPVMVEAGMGGSTSAGPIAGIREVREALDKAERRWEAERKTQPDDKERDEKERRERDHE